MSSSVWAVVAAVVTTAMSAGTILAVNIETVQVGKPGNAGDTRYPRGGVSSFGSVGYTYNIGKYEVTAGQYCEFLNKVAGVDTYGLYNTSMWSATHDDGCKIERYTGSGILSDPYRYRVASDWANRPVNYVSYWDACRFTNWLHNGQPTGGQGAGTTETGAYTLNGYNSYDGRTIQRNAGWKWAVTSEDEWYKAAYHKNDGVTGNYFNYPTSSDALPGRDLNDVSGNNANYWGSPYPIQPPYYATVAGEFQNSFSPYGTFDQGGNVWEWNEAIEYQDAAYASRGSRGGSFLNSDFLLHASGRYLNLPSDEGSFIGFRVSEVPEPATMLLLALGAGLLAKRRRPLQLFRRQPPGR